MAELNIKQKKDYARTLYLKENLTQQEIAERVGVARQTLSRWITTEKWEELRCGILQTSQHRIAEINRQIAEINRQIQSREPGKRFATAAEADTITKLVNAVKKLENETSISDIITVGMEFCDWLRPQDPDKAKEIVKLFDKFIKDKL